MTAHEKDRGTRAQWAQDRVLMALIWSARRLPYDRRIPAAGAFVSRAVRKITSYRERMLTNLDYVWPDMPDQRREEIANGAANNFGRGLIEHFSLHELKERLATSPLFGPGLEPLREAGASGRPVVLVSGHFGNYEAAWLGIQSLGLSMSGLYRPLSNPYLNQSYIRATEDAAGMMLHPQDRKGVAALSRHLRNGGTVAFLSDLYAGYGVEMDFLGRPALTGLTAAEFALKTDALLVPFYGLRKPDGLGFEIEIETPISASDPVAMMEAFNRSLAKRVEEHPEQWFWMHRRWKRKWRGGKGMDKSLHPAAYPRRKSK